MILMKWGVSMKRTVFHAPGTWLSAAGLLALCGMFFYWNATVSASTAGRAAALFSAILFGAVCLRFVPRWMEFWSKSPDEMGVSDAEPPHICLKIFIAFLAVVLSTVVLVSFLRRQWGYTDGLNFWTCTDSRHYLDIARDWYLSEGEWDRLVQLVFLPGYPIAIRLFTLLVPDTLIAGMIVSALSFAGSGCVFYKLLRLDLPYKDAIRALKYLCLLPGSFFFAAPMSESLFLLLSVTSLYCARKDQWLLAGLSGALAAFTRSLGLMLIVPLFFEWLHNVQKRKFPGNSMARAAAIALVPVGFAAYCYINFQVAGDPFQFMEYQNVHWGQRLGLFFNTAAYQTQCAIRCVRTNIPELLGLWLPNLIYGFGSLILILLTVKKLRPSDTAWFLAYYFVAMGATRLLSAPRYLIAMPTVSIALSALTEKQRTDTVITAVCAFLSFLYLCAFILRWQVW